MIERLKERFWMTLAWAMPRQLAYWAAARVIVHASYINSKTEMSALTPADCLKAWSKE